MASGTEQAGDEHDFGPLVMMKNPTLAVNFKGRKSLQDYPDQDNKKTMKSCFKNFQKSVKVANFGGYEKIKVRLAEKVVEATRNTHTHIPG